MSLIWWKAERLISDLPCSTGGSAILEDLQSGLSHRLDSGDILLVPSGVAHSLHAGSGAPLGPASSRPELKMTFSENAGSGGRALLNRLSAALFALTLRLASTNDAAPAGLLALAAHPRLSPALAAMLGSPAHSWTLPELSRLCNMSRATFARYFQRNLGRSAADFRTFCWTSARFFWRATNWIDH